MDIEVYSCVVGPLETNCYLLYNTVTSETVIIDTGEEDYKISEVIVKKGLKPVAIFITHGHFDHIGAANALRRKYDIKIYAPLDDKMYLENPSFNMSVDFYGTGTVVNADEWLEDGQVVSIAGIDIECISTPGHTKGGMCFLVKEAHILFAGDTLFRESHGRVDFVGGSMSQIKHSIVDKLFMLPDNTIVFPGHGPDTDIGYEKKYNYLINY